MAQMPDRSTTITGEDISVRQLFTTSDRRFRAPEFQRHYVWKAKDSDDQIPAFFSDIERLGEEGASDVGRADSLFLGAVVLQMEDAGTGGRPPQYSIIDGQQRITTLYLTLTAIAEAFQDGGVDDLAEDIETEYLLIRTGKAKGSPRLEPTVSDTNQFYQVIRCLKNPEPRLTSLGYGPEDHHLTAAWRRIRRTVRELVAGDDGGISISSCEELRDRVVDQLELVEVTLDTRHDPHEVYERLNNRGARLKPIDLIRNAVFLVAGSEPEVAGQIYAKHWEPFETELGLEHQDRYFFPYAIIRVPGTTKAGMYRNIKDYWAASVTLGQAGTEPAERIVNDLGTFVPEFRALTGIAKISGVSEECAEAVARLKRLAVPDMMYPYLMQLIHAHREGDEHLPKQSLVEIVDALDAFLVRRAFAGIRNTGLMPVFKDLWRQISADRDALVQRINTGRVRFPDNEEFENGIRTIDIFNSGMRNYILGEYERWYSKGDTEHWEIPFEGDHLLPQNPPAGSWSHISDEAQQRLKDTWANLVPVTQKGNSEKGAASWEDQRRMMIDESGAWFKSTRAVFDEYEHWDEDAINRRADELVAWALERWPKPQV